MTDKRFPPSIQRLKRARRDGKIIKSQLVTIAASWLGLLSLFLIGRSWVRIGTLIHWLESKVLDPGDRFRDALTGAFGVAFLTIGWIVVVTTVMSFLQTKGLFIVNQIAPNVARISPTRYFERLRESALDGVVALGRITFFMFATLPLVWSYTSEAALLFRAPREWISPIIGSHLGSIFVRGTWALLGIGCCAYGFRWIKFLRQHRMSFEELKEEHRQSEGDPHLRAARRNEHQIMAMAEVEKRVRGAKVLIVQRRPVGAH